MGAWGTGLYSDDTSCDVRDDYVKNLKHGLSNEEAYQNILDRYGKLLDQPEIATLVYFALADTAWRYGRLSESLKVKTLSLLKSGGDIFAWQHAPRAAASRVKVLRTLEARLNSAQPPVKPIKLTQPKPKKVRATSPPGSVFSLALPSGKVALLALVGYKELAESIDPVFSALSWRGVSIESSTLQIAVAAPTLPFSASRKQCEHVAILPTDERRSILCGLVPTSMQAEVPLSYNPESVVWLSIGRIAKEIDAYFDERAP